MSPYLILLQQVLTREIWLDDTKAREDRYNGKDWPTDAETMVGTLRLRNVAELCDRAIRNHVQGHFMECGVWKGGCGVMMAGVIREHGQAMTRRVIMADSFQGCPVPNSVLYPADAGDKHHELKFLAVNADVVRANFKRYGFTHRNYQIVPGWFKDTLSKLETGPLAVLRLDGDLYESTWQCLENLYRRVTKGGYVIIDDYGCVPGCRAAVNDFRAKHSIKAAMTEIDWTGVYWKV